MPSTSELTLVFLHAHPDDECILTGATIARAVSRGHRVIVVYATRGDAGETSLDLGDETMAQRREAEARAACEELGVHEIIFLGFADSGMAGTETASRPDAFCNVGMDDVFERLGGALTGEEVDVLVGYDANGTYGHPDHLRIHEVAHAVAAGIGASWVLDATYDRDHLSSLDPPPYGDTDETFASAHAELTHFVQGESEFRSKARAISHHRSQTPDDWDEDAPDLVGFAAAFGTEWFIATAVSGESDPAVLAGFLEAADAWNGPLVLES